MWNSTFTEIHQCKIFNYQIGTSGITKETNEQTGYNIYFTKVLKNYAELLYYYLVEKITH